MASIRPRLEPADVAVLPTPELPQRSRPRYRLPTQPLLRHLLLAVVAGVALFAFTAEISPYNDFQVTQIAAFVVAIAGITVLTGLNGQISLGHGAFMAVGAYGTALLLEHSHLPLAVVLVLSVVGAAVAGGIVGVAAARLRGPYLAGATLALALALPELASKYSGTLGGEQGIPLNPPTPPPALGTNFSPQLWLAWITIICALITLVLLANLVTSRYGRAFRAVRDDEIAASLSGIRVARTQVLAFVVSAACAGLGGGLLALATSIVNPAGFSVTLSIALLTGMVIGGLGSLTGAIWGAILVVYLPQWANSLSDHLNLSKGIGSNLALAVYGVVLIVVMLTFPSGIQGGLRRLWSVVRHDRAGSQ